MTAAGFQFGDRSHLGNFVITVCFTNGYRKCRIHRIRSRFSRPANRRVGMASPTAATVHHISNRGSVGSSQSSRCVFSDCSSRILTFRISALSSPSVFLPPPVLSLVVPFFPQSRRKFFFTPYSPVGSAELNPGHGHQIVAYPSSQGNIWRLRLVPFNGLINTITITYNTSSLVRPMIFRLISSQLGSPSPDYGSHIIMSISGIFFTYINPHIISFSSPILISGARNNIDHIHNISGIIYMCCRQQPGTNSLLPPDPLLIYLHHGPGTAVKLHPVSPIEDTCRRALHLCPRTVLRISVHDQQPCV